MDLLHSPGPNTHSLTHSLARQVTQQQQIQLAGPVQCKAVEERKTIKPTVEAETFSICLVNRHDDKNVRDVRHHNSNDFLIKWNFFGCEQ